MTNKYHMIWNWSDEMIFNTGAALLDAIVLAVVSKEPEGTYGYKITQDVRRSFCAYSLQWSYAVNTSPFLSQTSSHPE